jgi:hypothetical protein
MVESMSSSLLVPELSLVELSDKAESRLFVVELELSESSACATL